MSQLLNAAERDGFGRATALLDLWGLAWMPDKGAPPWPKYPPGSQALNADRAEGLRTVGAQLRRAHPVALWRAGATFDYPG